MFKASYSHVRTRGIYFALYAIKTCLNCGPFLPSEGVYLEVCMYKENMVLKDFSVVQMIQKIF